MNTEKNKDLFLKQVEQILDGIKKDKEKVCVLLLYLYDTLMYVFWFISLNDVGKMRRCSETQQLIYILNL